MIYIADLNDEFFDSLLYLNEYYGITWNPLTRNFIIIMKYYKSDLRNYITENFYNIDWNKKLKILTHIVEGLNHIHKQNIIHRDLHSKNILCENEDDVVISDLGISKSAMESTDDNENFGIISYMAPEIWQRKKYTTSSDIYSFSMIMWELMTGRKPFWNWDPNGNDLMIKIQDGLRPSIVTDAPKDYIKLMRECWNSDPNRRPTTANIFKRLTDMIIFETNNPTEIIKSSDIGPTITNNSDRSGTISIRSSSSSVQGN